VGDCRGFVLARQFLGLDLAGFNVGLVESINADDGACNSGRDFPSKEFLAKIVNIGSVIRTTGCPAFSRAATAASWALLGFEGQAQIGKDAIVAIGRWLGEAFAVNGNNAFADFLPVDSAINCSSHAPRSEIPGEVTIVILSRP